MRLLAIILLVPFIAMSQGTNNDISNRSKLVLDAEATVSNTDHNTVEWDCLNKKLTEKCLVYHNDQWFTFDVEKDGDYFINIASKNCRDKMGVQLIIIEGNPCEVSTYRIIECIRRIQQGIVHVDLKGIKAGVSYLVNVDGFEGDFCEFNIQLGTVPWKAVTPKSIEELEAEAKRKNKPIELFWELKDESEKTLTGFTVWRERVGSHQKGLVREMGVGFNALGKNATRYTMTDTLPAPGIYEFEIVGLLPDSIPTPVAKYEVTWDGVRVNFSPPLPPTTIATFPLAAEAGAPVQVILYNQENADRLWKRSFVYDPGKHTIFKLDLEPWLKQGLKRFLVVVIDEARREPLELYFMTDRNGNVVQE